MNFSITLSEQDVAVLLNVLANGPYNVVAPIISGIQAQCQQQVAAAQQAKELRA